MDKLYLTTPKQLALKQNISGSIVRSNTQYKVSV